MIMVDQEIKKATAPSMFSSLTSQQSLSGCCSGNWGPEQLEASGQWLITGLVGLATFATCAATNSMTIDKKRANEHLTCAEIWLKNKTLNLIFVNDKNI